MEDNEEIIEIEIDSDLLDEVRMAAAMEGLTPEELISRILDQFITKNCL